MTTDTPLPTGRSWQDEGWPRFEFRHDPSRHEINFLVRSPYICLRLGRTQCALWWGNLHNVFNLFPAGGWRGLKGDEPWQVP